MHAQTVLSYVLNEVFMDLAEGYLLCAFHSQLSSRGYATVGKPPGSRGSERPVHSQHFPVKDL